MNTRAALLTRGLYEISKIGVACNLIITLVNAGINNL
jgi:glycerol-3-phosphate dehydrogenase